MIHSAVLSEIEAAQIANGGRLPEGLSNHPKSVRRGRRAMGQRLRHMRQDRGLTLSDVARSLGVTTACVCQWEAGKSYPKPHFWADLAQAVGTTASYLITGEEEPSRTLTLPPAEVIERARREIATAFGLEMSKIRIEVDHGPNRTADFLDR